MKIGSTSAYSCPRSETSKLGLEFEVNLYRWILTQKTFGLTFQLCSRASHDHERMFLKSWTSSELPSQTYFGKSTGKATSALDACHVSVFKFTRVAVSRQLQPLSPHQLISLVRGTKPSGQRSYCIHIYRYNRSKDRQIHAPMAPNPQSVKSKETLGLLATAAEPNETTFWGSS